MLPLIPIITNIAWPFIKSNWKIFAVIALVGGAYLYVQNLKHTISEHEKTIATLTVQRDALQDSNNKLAASIAVSNKAIDEIRTLAPNTKKEFDKLNAKVSSQSEDIAAKVRRILEEKKPLTCEETIDYLIRAQKEFK
jgi:seryl-tRNA synthetase